MVGCRPAVTLMDKWTALVESRECELFSFVCGTALKQKQSAEEEGLCETRKWREMPNRHGWRYNAANAAPVEVV